MAPKLAIGITACVVIARLSAAQDMVMTGYITGDKLMAQCTIRVPADGGLCLGYILGVVDAMQAAQASGGTLFGWRTAA
jgi:hypothetical protein